MTLLFVPHIDNELQHRDRLFRIHPTDGRVAVSRCQHRTIAGQNEFSRLNKVPPFIPPGTEQISIGARHTVCHGKTEWFSNL